MATTKTKQTPVQASEERMLAAWMALSEAEMTPGVPVSRLDHLYYAYVRTLHEHVATVREAMAWKCWAAGGGH